MIQRLALLFCLLLTSTLAHAETEREIQEAYLKLDASYLITRATTDEAMRNQIFESASKDPVASLDVNHKYDPTGKIGFCFGRALAVHLYARALGLDPSSIKKLFVTGDLRSGEKPEWRFHVTTVILGEDGKTWYALDPIMTSPIGPGGPIPASQWMRIVKKVWDRPNKAKFYLVDRHAITPHINIDYANEIGDKLMELSFKPEKTPGFIPAKIGAYKVHEVDQTNLEKHFLLANGPANHRFPFDSLSVAGQFFPFNGYFDLMMKNFEVPRTLVLNPEETCRSRSAKLGRGESYLGSPSFY